MREHAVEWARDPFEIKRLDEHDGVPLLAVPHEAVQVLLERSVAVRRLFLERPERAQLALFCEDALHPFGAHRACQFVFEIARAGEEAGALESVPIGAAECAQEVRLFSGVVEPRELEAAVRLEIPRQVAVAAHRYDDDTFPGEVAATPPREHLDRALIARAFDQDDCAQGATSCRRRSRPRARGGS